MAKRAHRPDPALEVVRDEAVYIPKGDTVYEVQLDEETVESLERGICPESLANRMHSLLSWRREAIRQATRSAAPLCAHPEGPPT